MGTNFFAVIPVKERTINKLQEIVDALKKNPLDVNKLAFRLQGVAHVIYNGPPVKTTF